MGPLEPNPFTYGSPLSPGSGIRRPEEIELLLRMALSAQNTRISAPRRFGKTTLIEDLREEAEKHDLNTVRVDLYGVLSRRDVAVRLKNAYKNMRGPVQRHVEDLLQGIGLKATAAVGPASVEADASRTETDEIDRVLIDLLDLPTRFHERKGARTLVIFDEFQDVLQADGGVDAIIRSRIQHQRKAASYLFAGSHPGMLEELFGNRDRPLFDQARPVPLEPLGRLAVSEYVEGKFKETGRSAGPPLDFLVELADGHPQRVMMLAHHLWEQTPAGEPATEDGWELAVDAVFRELQEQYERAWSASEKKADQLVLDTVSQGSSGILSASSLKAIGVSKSTAARSRDRLLQAGDLRHDDQGGLRFVDPLYGAWIRAGRRPPRRARRRSPAADPIGESQSPFGVADGARASVGDLGRGYVEVRRGVSPRESRAVRVVVGRKGAGKTLWLLRQQASLSDEPSVYVAPTDYSAPRTAHVARVAELYPRNLLTEIWSSIWRVAVLRTVVSHLETDRFDAPEIRAPDVMPRFGVPTSLASQVDDLIMGHGEGRDTLDAYLFASEWDRVEHKLAQALRGVPPMYFFLDALDEEFRHAPAFWLAAQKGLYFQVMRMLGEPRFARLHIHICMRDLAYTSMLGSEHATRYIDTRHVQLLHWDEGHIASLLSEKVRGLPDARLVRAERGASMEGWLGHSSIDSDDIPGPEPLDRYLMRHTRMLPRDIVVMGNALCQVVDKAVQVGDSAVNPAEIRRTVTEISRLFGVEQIAICASQIAAEAPPGAEHADFAAIYDGEDRYRLAYAPPADTALRKALLAVGADRFGLGEMDALREKLEASFGDASAPLTALWQNGMLGYIEEGVPVFYGARPYGELHMPVRGEGFLLHPVVVYALGLRSGMGRT